MFIIDFIKSFCGIVIISELFIISSFYKYENGIAYSPYHERSVHKVNYIINAHILYRKAVQTDLLDKLLKRYLMEQFIASIAIENTKNTIKVNDILEFSLLIMSR